MEEKYEHTEETHNERACAGRSRWGSPLTRVCSLWRCAPSVAALQQTTLLNILGTIDSATSGSVEMFGEIIDANSSDKKLADLRLQKIGFVFQVSRCRLASHRIASPAATSLLSSPAPSPPLAARSPVCGCR